MLKKLAHQHTVLDKIYLYPSLSAQNFTFLQVFGGNILLPFSNVRFTKLAKYIISTGVIEILASPIYVVLCHIILKLLVPMLFLLTTSHPDPGTSVSTFFANKDTCLKFSIFLVYITIFFVTTISLITNPQNTQSPLSHATGVVMGHHR